MRQIFNTTFFMRTYRSYFHMCISIAAAKKK